MENSNAPFPFRTLAWFVGACIYLRVLYLAVQYAWHHYQEVVRIFGLIPLIVVFVFCIMYLVQALPHDWWRRRLDRSFPAKIDRQVASVAVCLQYLSARRDQLHAFRMDLEHQYHRGVEYVLEVIKEDVDANLYQALEMERILDLSMAYCRQLQDELNNLKGNYLLLLQSQQLKQQMYLLDQDMDYLTGFLHEVQDAFTHDFKRELYTILDSFPLSDDQAQLPFRPEWFGKKKRKDRSKCLPSPEMASSLLLDEIRLRVEQLRNFERLHR